MLSSESDTIYEFTDEEKKLLNSTPIKQESDPLYFRYLLEFLYKDDMNVMKHRSLTGRKNEQNKEVKCISPEKKEIIFNMFTKRIENSQISLQEKAKRIDSKYIGQRISCAIGTIRKSLVKINASGPHLPLE